MTIREGKWEEKVSIGYLNLSTAELLRHLQLSSMPSMFTLTIRPYRYWQWSVLCGVVSGLLQNTCSSLWYFLGSPPTKWVWVNLLLLGSSWVQVQIVSRSSSAFGMPQPIYRGKQLTEVKTNNQTSVFLLKEKWCGKRSGFVYSGQRKDPVIAET